MTDARFPERWLNDRRILRLSDAAFRLHVLALAWSVSNRTDGVIQADDFGLMLSVDPSQASVLVAAGLWRKDGDRHVIVDFAATQTSRSQLEGLDRRRQQDRVRAQRYRERKASRDSSRDDKGQDRPGQARTGAEGKEAVTRQRQLEEARAWNADESADDIARLRRSNDDPWK